MPSSHREVISRPTAGRGRAFGITAVWGLTAAMTLLFAHVTAIGPILVRLTQTHGVHLGDVVFALLAFVIAGIFTVLVARPR